MAQESDLNFDIDTDVPTLSAFAAASRSPRPPAKPPNSRLSRDQWFALPPSDRTIWDQLSPQSKAIILQSTAPPPAPAPSSGPRRRLNLHDISAADYLDLMSIHQHHSSPSDASHSGPSAVTYEDTASTPTAEPASILAMATKQAKRPPVSWTSTAKPAGSSTTSAVPGDIRRVLGNPGSNYQVTVHRITYRVSAHQATIGGSLVDRGANGGLAGNDVCIIHKSENPRTVDVSGIDGHEICGLPIVTVGGVPAWSSYCHHASVCLY